MSMRTITLRPEGERLKTEREVRIILSESAAKAVLSTLGASYHRKATELTKEGNTILADMYRRLSEKYWQAMWQLK